MQVKVAAAPNAALDAAMADSTKDTAGADSSPPESWDVCSSKQGVETIVTEESVALSGDAPSSFVPLSMADASEPSAKVSSVITTESASKVCGEEVKAKTDVAAEEPGNLGGLFAKWAPTPGGAHDRATGGLLLQQIASKVWERIGYKDSSKGVKDAAGELHTGVAPLRRIAQVPEALPAQTSLRR